MVKFKNIILLLTTVLFVFAFENNDNDEYLLNNANLLSDNGELLANILNIEDTYLENIDIEILENLINNINKDNKNKEIIKELENEIIDLKKKSNIFIDTIEYISTMMEPITTTAEYISTIIEPITTTVDYIITIIEPITTTINNTNTVITTLTNQITNTINSITIFTDYSTKTTISTLTNQITDTINSITTFTDYSTTTTISTLINTINAITIPTTTSIAMTTANPTPSNENILFYNNGTCYKIEDYVGSNKTFDTLLILYRKIKPIECFVYCSTYSQIEKPPWYFGLANINDINLMGHKTNASECVCANIIPDSGLSDQCVDNYGNSVGNDNSLYIYKVLV
jgi:hypothetical protein